MSEREWRIASLSCVEPDTQIAADPKETFN
jgi:hypothetical protein